MKILAIIALVIGAIGLMIGLYCQIEIVPNFNSLDLQPLRGELENQLWGMYHEQKFVYGSAAMGLGALGVLTGLISGVKKQKLGWIALGISFVAFFLGAAQSTHIFS
jgi:hypothetical protein